MLEVAMNHPGIRFTRLLLWLLCATSSAAHGQTWVEATGRPSSQAREALQLLADASAEGLDSADYDAQRLVEAATRLSHIESPQDALAASFDAAMERAMQRYLHDLQFGRVDPHGLGYRIPPRMDAARVLLRHDPSSVAASVASARPRFNQYGRLKDALVRYRQLAANDSLRPQLPRETVRPAQSLPDAQALAQWLAALGDLPVNAPMVTDRYDDALVEAVKRFQSRHGLEADGVIGRATRLALAVPMRERVQQIEMAMERLRWLDSARQGRFIAVNIPNFTLWAWDLDDPHSAPPLTMGVIVGRALNTRTPVLQEDMRYVVFRPYWNVPRSIVLKELLPRIRRDPGILAREKLQIVDGDGDNALPVPPTAAHLDMLAKGRLRLRQLPGEHNSLGLVKFIFPNDSNVYLHGTPAQGLFRNARRDFSHGCVRVQRPVDLAEWVLGRQAGWTRDRILAAMAGDRPQTVELRQPIPVLLFYTTAFVSPVTGELHFADDLYGHDQRLLRALRQRQVTRPAPGRRPRARSRSRGRSLRRPAADPVRQSAGRSGAPRSCGCRSPGLPCAGCAGRLRCCAGAARHWSRGIGTPR